MKMTKRPTRRSEEILRPAMKELFENDIKKLDDYGEDCDCIDSLVRNYEDDGYEFAKNLDNDCWIVDFRLCEVLDSASRYVHSHLIKAEKEWFQANKFSLFAVGDGVIVNKPFSTVQGKYCIVTSVKNEIAQYTVVEKEKYIVGKSGGYVVNHEELQLVNG